MASIGAITVDTIVGSVLPAALSGDAFARKGSDRIDRRDLGNRPTPTQISTTSIITTGQAAADAARKARLALKRTFVTIVDGHGTSHANVFIAEVAAAAGRAVIYRNAAAIQLRTQWIVEGG